MSKMGDLIVRLKLQYEDYKKGLKNATADTKGFAGTLGKIKGVGLAVWGAIGAGATAMVTQFVNHSQTMGDMWNQVTGQMKTVWSQFLTSLTNWDWEGFGQRVRNAMDATSQSILAHDAEFEVMNSIKMRKAAMSEELAQLQIVMRDTRKSYDERAKAAQAYLDKVKPLYEEEIKLRKRQYLTDTAEYLKKAGVGATADNTQLLRKFFTDIAPDGKLMQQLVEYQKKNLGQQFKLSKSDLADIDKFYEQYGMRAAATLNTIAYHYQSTNDDVANKVIDAIVAYDKSLAAMNEETRRIQNVQNSALAMVDKADATPEVKLAKIASAHEMAFKLGKEMENDIRLLNEELEVIGDIDIDMSDVDSEIQAFLDNWAGGVQEVMALNNMLEDSIIQATSGGLQAFTDMLMGIEGADASDVLAALLQPFASTATQLGSLLLAEGLGIKAFKDSLKSLNPAIAIGAGTALIALGAALGSAIKALGGGNNGGTSSVANGGYSSSSSTGSGSYDTELTIYVKGKLDGGDIFLSGQRTRNEWGR